MRRIAIVNQKGGVGKTTTAANLGAALALRGRRVVLVDLDPQGNLSTHLDVEVEDERPSTYGVLCDGSPLGDAMRATSTPGLFVVPADIDLSGAEMELAAALGRESILRDAIEAWEESAPEPFDYIIFDCPPSLGLLAVNGLVAAREVFITLQTEFFALKGMSKLVEIVQLLKRRLNPELEISGIIACLYDSRLRLAREVLAEIRRYFPGPVFRRSIRTNVKLAEAPSHGVSIFDYAPESAGASDYRELADEVLAQEPGAVVEPVAEPTAEAPSIAAGPSEPMPQPKPVTTPDPKPVPTPEPKPVRTPDPKPVPTPEPTPVPTPEPYTEPQATSEVALEPSEPTPSAEADANGNLPQVELQAQPAPEREAADAPKTTEGGGTSQPSRPHFERRAPSLDNLPRAEDLPPLPEEAFRTFEP